MNIEAHKKQLKAIVGAINQSWLKNNLDNLEFYFHENMVISDSNFNKLAGSRKECIASYKSFIEQANILSYKEEDMKVDVIGNTAVVNYVFDIAWDVNGNVSSEKGRDVFVFEYSDTRWTAVWRTILPLL